MALKRVEEKESHSTRASHVAARADVTALQEATGSTLGAVSSAVGGDRKLEPDDVRGAFSSGDAEDGWEDCRLSALRYGAMIYFV